MSRGGVSGAHHDRVGSIDTAGDEEDWGECRHHPDREASNRVGRRAGLGHLGNVRDCPDFQPEHRLDTGVVLGHEPYQDADQAADGHRIERLGRQAKVIQREIAASEEEPRADESRVAQCSGSVATLKELD